MYKNGENEVKQNTVTKIINKYIIRITWMQMYLRFSSYAAVIQDTVAQGAVIQFSDFLLFTVIHSTHIQAAVI